MGKLLLLAGCGYLVGARGGRARYDQMLWACRRASRKPAVQEAAGVLQVQAVNLFSVVAGRIPARGVG